MKPSQQGFSLVELSIVLVILGLLVGGVLTGQSLIRAAELRSVTTEFQKYQAATNTFRDKYFQLPGDMNNATSFWGAAVVNGDGDGAYDVAAAVSTAGEEFGFWQQLALAGLIEGAYTGTSGPANIYDALIGTNVARSKLSNAGWSVRTIASAMPVTDLTWFEGEYGNFFHFGGAGAAGYTAAVILSPEDSWNIDNKMDDGRPGQGAVRTMEISGHATTGCSNPAPAATATAGTAVYDLDNKSIACSMLFIAK